MSSTARLPSASRLILDFVGDLHAWLVTRGPCWATSIVAHAVALSFGMLLVSTVAPLAVDSSPVFEAASVDTEIPLEPERVVVAAEIEPPSRIDLSVASPSIDLANDLLDDADAQGTNQDAAGTREAVEGSPGEHAFSIGVPAHLPGSGPASHVERIGPSRSGSGGDWGLTSRSRRLHGTGRTRASEQSVGMALRWIARHQNQDGSWSLGDFTHQCTDATCTGAGNAKADAAATALGLLPFLAAGQTHETKGPYKKNIYASLYWLTSKQKNDGDLSAGSPHRMYAHGLATIAVAEAAGMTRDHQLRASAQQAVKFIEAAQNQATGGWRYQPGEAGDTSVAGWQVMALKSAQMADLTVDAQVLRRASEWLDSVATPQAGRFAYQPGGAVSPTTSSIGLLSQQYLGAQRKEPAQQAGQTYLLANLPVPAARNAYYWYYATQVMHNLQGAEWDAWNRQIRAVLIQSQATEGCAKGSWDPLLPSKDPWAEPGGRLLVTSLNCLTLQVYYRYLPLYRTDEGQERQKP